MATTVFPSYKTLDDTNIAELRNKESGLPLKAGDKIAMRGGTLNESTADKLTGKTDAMAGKLRWEVGKIVGNREMQARGAVQEAKGTAQQAKGRIKSALKNVIDKI